MRILRIAAVLLTVASVIFCGWATYTYRQKQNHDIPVLMSDVEMLEISVTEGEKGLLRGLTATDATDGDLTDQIMVASASHFLEPGVVNVKYVVFDAHNNSATLTRKVKYTDYESPRFVLKDSPVYIKNQAFDLLSRIEVEDCLDGDIADDIRILSSSVSNYMTGNFPIVLQVSNSCGDTVRVELMVSYVEKADTTVDIRLKDYILYLNKGDTFDPEAQLDRAVAPGNEAIPFDRIEVGGTLDVNTPGTYHLTYSYADGTNRGQTNLTVVVEEAGDAQ